MARVRNNQGNRRKIEDIFIRPYLEQENTQEREAYLQAWEQIKPLQTHTFNNVMTPICRKLYTKDDVEKQKWGNGSGEENHSNPHWTQTDNANERELGLSGGSDNQTSHAKQWNDDYKLDLIGREYCRDRSIGCKKEEFDQLMIWQVAKAKLIQCHTKWIETILEQCKLLKSVLRDHTYLEQSIDLCNKMGITISETDILATTSKGIVVSNKDIINHLATLKNKTQTREQKIALRKLYDQQQAQK